MESAAHADVPVDANALHAHATAGDLNPAAQRDADRVVTDVDAKCSKIKQQHIALFFIT
jgi:hypothetical protein